MMDSRELIRYIREKLHIKRGDNLPFTGFNFEANRDTIAEIIGEAGFKVGVELGVRMGGYAHVLCTKVPDLKLYCIDPYTPWEGGRPTQESQDKYFAHAQRKLRGMNVEFVKKFSIDAAKDFERGSLDFVHIDAAHNFDNVMLDLILWVPKVKNGGIVLGHDYYEGYNHGVVDAVRSYTRAHCVNEWYLVYGPQKDHPFNIPSWFWVRT